jgi:hypothetical protein
MEMIVNTNRSKHIVELKGEPSSSPPMDWFADNIEVLWIPIYELPHGSDDLKTAEQLYRKHGDHRILRSIDDFGLLPVGIRGWLIPATANDSDVICIKDGQSVVEFESMVHPDTGERMTYQSSKAYDIKLDVLQG